MQDAVVTAAVVDRTRGMTQNEHQDWLKTVEINERGVMVDTALASLSLQYADAEQSEIAAKLNAATHGAVERHTQNIRIKKWVVEQMGELHPIVNMMTVYKKGIAKLSLDKNVRRNLLAAVDDEAVDVPDNIKNVIQLLDDGNKSSVAKFKRMIERAEDDDRVRGAFVFAGASQTLRYASRGLQLHNMRRDCWSYDETESMKVFMQHGGDIKTMGLSVMDTLSKLLRPAIIPAPGKVLVVGDWSSIESRMLHFATNSEAGDTRLDFIESGGDVYQNTSDNLRLNDRQKGKVAELALGYQGAVKAFQAMARNYGLKVNDTESQRIVDGWRAINWHVVEFWAKLERAAKSAIGSPGKKFDVGTVSYTYMPDFIEGTLMCNLGASNFIQYPKARIELVMTPYGKEVYSVTALKAGFKPKADAKEWPRAALYGGLFCENVCQAQAAALLRHSVSQLDNVVAHVHDEIVLEVPEAYADQAKEELKKVMLTPPGWAIGLPLAMEPQILHRYGK